MPFFLIYFLTYFITSPTFQNSVHMPFTSSPRAVLSPVGLRRCLRRPPPPPLVTAREPRHGRGRSRAPSRGKPGPGKGEALRGGRRWTPVKSPARRHRREVAAPGWGGRLLHGRPSLTLPGSGGQALPRDSCWGGRPLARPGPWGGWGREGGGTPLAASRSNGRRPRWGTPFPPVPLPSPEGLRRGPTLLTPPHSSVHPQRSAPARPRPTASRPGRWGSAARGGAPGRPWQRGAARREEEERGPARRAGLAEAGKPGEARRGGRAGHSRCGGEDRETGGRWPGCGVRGGLGAAGGRGAWRLCRTHPRRSAGGRRGGGGGGCDSAGRWNRALRRPPTKERVPVSGGWLGVARGGAAAPRLGARGRGGVFPAFPPSAGSLSATLALTVSPRSEPAAGCGPRLCQAGGWARLGPALWGLPRRHRLCRVRGAKGKSVQLKRRVGDFCLQGGCGAEKVVDALKLGRPPPGKLLQPGGSALGPGAGGGRPPRLFRPGLWKRGRFTGGTLYCYCRTANSLFTPEKFHMYFFQY